jgi:chemotaxis protein methyltransferase CheR
MLYSRLARRLRALNLKSFAHYYELLLKNEHDELVNFINAVTTNLTSFFREPHHFDLLATQILPNLMTLKQEQQRLRIWSAGCASGEEAYSLAMVIREVVPSYWDVKILASDLDSAVLEKGRLGIYEDERLEGISPARLHRWVKRGTGEQQGKAQMSKELQALISFRQLNLIQAWPMRGLFDIIFCRNVAIYFDRTTQIMLFDRFANILEKYGYLFIGHSENLFQLTDRFRLLQQTVYVHNK